MRLVAATFTATNRQQPDTVAITATLRLKLGLEAQRMVSASGSLAGDVADGRNVLRRDLTVFPFAQGAFYQERQDGIFRLNG